LIPIPERNMPSSTAHADDGSLAFTDIGSGPPLVLLHAFPLDRGMWEPQWTALGDRYRIIAVDLPGFGESPADPGFTVESAADRVAQLLDRLKLQQVALGGLSMGGYVALAFARKHPDRLTALILADTRSEADDAAGKEGRSRLIKLTEEFGPSKVYEGMLPKVLGAGTQESQPQVVAFVRGLATRQTAEGVIGGLTALRDRPDATPSLEKIDVPTLILVGSEDGLTPPELSDAMGKQIRGSKVIRIPGAGHLSNVENPTAFNAAVAEFLNS
jgi:3-oxoadipate enol-lactonase